MVSDLGQAAKRLGPIRHDVIRMVMGGGGDELQILVPDLIFAAERQIGNGNCLLPGPAALRKIGFAIAGEGKLAAVHAARPLIDHAADR